MSLAQSKHSQIASAAERIFSTSFFQNKQKQPPPRQFLLPFMSFILATDYVVQNSKPNYVSLLYTQTSSWEQASRPILRIFGKNESNHLLTLPHQMQNRAKKKIYISSYVWWNKAVGTAKIFRICPLYCVPALSYHGSYLTMNNFFGGERSLHTQACHLCRELLPKEYLCRSFTEFCLPEKWIVKSPVIHWPYFGCHILDTK